MFTLIRKIDPYAVILLIACAVVFLIKCIIVYPVEYVGHADASSYAEMADSLIHGRGFEVDYISWYFIKYSPDIVRPEDHWPPLYSIAIAPFFIIFGKTAFAAKLPSLIVSCFFLPLVIYSLAKALSGSRFPGITAGLSVLLYPAFFEWSLHCLSDVFYAFIVCAYVLFAAKALDNEKSFYPAGVFMGLAYYAKGSGLILIPCHILFYFIARFKIVRRKKSDQPVLDNPLNPPLLRENKNGQGILKGLIARHKKFLISLLIAFLILLPWFIRNYVHFRDPLFSTQRFAAGYGGYVDWEVGTYDLYWGEKPPPTYLDKFNEGFRRVVDMTKDYLKTYTWWLFMDINSRWGKFGKVPFLTYFTNIPAVLGLFLLWGNKKRHIIWIVSAALLAFLSAGWFPIDRLTLPMTALMMALGWATYYFVLKNILKFSIRILRNTVYRWYISLRRIIINRLFPIIHYPSLITHYILLVTHQLLRILRTVFRPEIAAGILVCFLAFPVVILSTENVKAAYKNRGYPYHDADQEWMDMGRWLRANAPPDSITMTRNPWELHFYSEQLAIQIPRASLDKTIEVMRFYKPDYIIPQLNIRPSLEPLVKGKIPGLELVYDNKKLQLYKIRYDLLPK